MQNIKKEASTSSIKKSARNGLPFRVSVMKRPNCKKKFAYLYQIDGKDNKHKIHISSTNIRVLERKVLDRGLQWNWLEFELEELESIENRFKVYFT